MATNRRGSVGKVGFRWIAVLLVMGVFSIPTIEQDRFQKKTDAGAPADYNPKPSRTQETAVVSYNSPADPSMSDGIVSGEGLSGSSYAS